MPEHAEPREFGLSEYQRSRYRIFSFLCLCAAALSLVDLAGSPDPVASLSVEVLGASVVAGWFTWIKSGRPFARLSQRGLTLYDGVLLPWSASWTTVYAIEASGDRIVQLRLAGSRLRRVPLTMFEREDRRDFVEAVRKWIYTSH